MTDRINIAQIGCGYWGPNILRNLMANKKCNVKRVADKSIERQEYVRSHYPQIATTDNYQSAIEDSGVSAIVIATPAETHYAIAMEALEAGKHVFVEKPLAMSSEEAEKLLDASRRKNLKLFVGHTFLYNDVVRKIKEYIDSGDLGEIYYIYGQRLNLGKVRQDVNAMWNLAPHDISMILYWFGETPDTVSANGLCFLQEGIEDVVFMNLKFPGGKAAHIHCSWLDPLKVRRMVLVGSKKMLVYDDVSTDAKITIFDKGIDKKSINVPMEPILSFSHFQLMQRQGDVVIPHIKFREPLSIQVEHFADCILNDKTPLTDGLNGLEVVKVLETAQRSMKTARKP